MSRWLILVLSFSLVGCGTLGTLDRSVGYSGERVVGLEVNAVPVCGHLVRLKGKVDGKGEIKRIKGELIAVDNGDLWIGWDDTLNRVHPESYIKVRLLADRYTLTAQWTLAGLAAVPSTGSLSAFHLGSVWFPPMLFPMWLLGGSVAALGSAVTGDLEVGLDDVDQLYQYARFPQGPPPQLRQGGLHLPSCKRSRD